MAFRGRRNPGDPDTLYGSIYRAAPADETVTGLQHKFLFLLNLLQNADARPTTQAQEAVEQLERDLESLLTRWEGLR